jgi:hypothetical protein
MAGEEGRQTDRERERVRRLICPSSRFERKFAIVHFYVERSDLVFFLTLPYLTYLTLPCLSSFLFSFSVIRPRYHDAILCAIDMIMIMIVVVVVIVVSHYNSRININVGGMNDGFSRPCRLLGARRGGKRKEFHFRARW